MTTCFYVKGQKYRDLGPNAADAELEITYLLKRVSAGSPSTFKIVIPVLFEIQLYCIRIRSKFNCDDSVNNHIETETHIAVTFFIGKCGWCERERSCPLRMCEARNN